MPNKLWTKNEIFCKLYISTFFSIIENIEDSCCMLCKAVAEEEYLVRTVRELIYSPFVLPPKEEMSTRHRELHCSRFWWNCLQEKLIFSMLIDAITFDTTSIKQRQTTEFFLWKLKLYRTDSTLYWFAGIINVPLKARLNVRLSMEIQSSEDVRMHNQTLFVMWLTCRFLPVYAILH